ncbi:histone-lysine N-methyltransferase SETMAR-like [Aplysia californica]|uniref:Histone-lysine N-methyltransferase SETMAR-like n=1 Tax=Aplysia californica TaxID=6500 RepID=A0ABM0ZZF3_APLCA|nr:histone-lysine N-methyltransferase SETMAR-like [Aplysia californica]
MTVFWDFDGLIHMEFLEQGSTINSERYIETLRKLRARLSRVRPGKNAILHHDRPHTSRHTQDATKSLRLQETLQHPPYSPDLAPSDFYLYPKLKEYLKGKRYADDDEVQEDVRRGFRGKSHEFFADGMRQFIRRWLICINKEDDYVEKYSYCHVADILSFHLV